MDISFTYKKGLLGVFFFFVSLSGIGQVPLGYYDEADGKSGAELKTALHNIIRVHQYLDFDAGTYVWWYDYFTQTDWHPGGYYWDMYSNDRYSDYNGYRQNREHSMPRSWFGTAGNYGDANGDLHNLYPSNYEANTAKSNLPLGEVGYIGSGGFDNGVVKVGRSNFPGYSGTVFEPADEYKGDFARTYMYMVTCYEDYYRKWQHSSMLIVGGTASSKYPTLNTYGVNLLMKWHIQDPVSEKEINRNNAVYSIQHNRNPFVDHPNFANLIWEQSTEIEFSLAVYPNPTGNHIAIDFNGYDPGDVHYNIYSINGILMGQGQLELDREDGNIVYVDKLNNGVYILVIYANGKRFNQKFVKYSPN